MKRGGTCGWLMRLQAASPPRSAGLETSARAPIVTTPARRRERIEIDDEISALLQAVQEERSHPDTPDIAARRVRAAAGWDALASARHILVRLASSLRAGLEHGAGYVFSRRYAIIMYVLAGLLAISLGMAVGLLIGRA